LWQRVREGKLDLYICLALALAVFATYAQVARYDFVNFDDPSYITDNPHLRNGISVEGLRWALTSGEAGYWFPVTRISELLDWQLFGLRSGPHHLTNVVWHILATLFLFAFLHRATGARWRSAFVACLFALHPLHVESVAWVTERKDVLSAFFWFLALWGYARYTERASTARYLLVLVSFCLGLMSKPMLVTLPLVLVLLDFWPFGRWSPKTPSLKDLRLQEKIPFFVLSAAAAITTYLAQRSAGAVVAVSGAPLGMRMGNALVSYVIYIGKTLWPADLAVFYPYQKDQPPWQPILAAMAIAGISTIALRSFRRRPYLAVGWLWYLVTLLPVIGLVQAGEQAYADRFTYLPMVGLLIMLAWWLPARPAVAAIAAVVCLAAILATWVQIGYWKNSESLYRHALDVTQDNYLAHYQLGVFLAETPSRIPEAIEEYRSALRTKPSNAAALNNLGVALSKTPGRQPEAIADYEAALRLQPDYVLALNNLGAALSRIPGRLPEAIGKYQAALRVQPESAALHYNLGQAYARMGRWPEAVSEYETALRIEPGNAEAHNDLAIALSTMPGRLQDAIAEYQEAARRNAGYAAPHNNLGTLLAETPSRIPDAIAEYQAALRIEPDNAEFHKNLGNAQARSSHMPEAIAEYRSALRLRPDFGEAHNNLGFALANVEGRLPEAIEQFEEAVRLQPEYGDAQRNLGYALLKLPGRTREAITHLDAALRLKPDPQLQRMVEQLKAGTR
jgi:tetratricopeptide (TPR) repeat protein